MLIGYMRVSKADGSQTLYHHVDPNGLRPHRGRCRDAGRGLLSEWYALVGAAHEKGGKRHNMPAHNKLEAFLDEYFATPEFATRARAPSSARRALTGGRAPRVSE